MNKTDIEAETIAILQQTADRVQNLGLNARSYLKNTGGIPEMNLIQHSVPPYKWVNESHNGFIGRIIHENNNINEWCMYIDAMIQRQNIIALDKALDE